MDNINKCIRYYIINIIIVLIFAIGSYIYINSDNNIFKNINFQDKENILEVKEEEKMVINLNNKLNKSGLLKVNNNGNLNSNYELLYRIYDTNIDTDKIKLSINDKYYNYNDIIKNSNKDYTELYIYSNNINKDETNDIKLAFVVDTIDSDIYIKGEYVINSINSLIVFK